MRQTVLAVALAGLIALPACHPKPKGGPPAAPTTAPAAPATPPPAPEPPPSRDVTPVEDEYSRMRKMATDEIERMGLLSEIHFDFDRADIREADRALLTKNAEALKKFDFLRVTIEGHSDERGTVEYNLALGERRAKAALRLPRLPRGGRRPPQDGVLRQRGSPLPAVHGGLLGAEPPGSFRGHGQGAPIGRARDARTPAACGTRWCGRPLRLPALVDSAVRLSSNSRASEELCPAR
jgi:peptidoglycan-associated lipoprotein